MNAAIFLKEKLSEMHISRITSSLLWYSSQLAITSLFSSSTSPFLNNPYFVYHGHFPSVTTLFPSLPFSIPQYPELRGDSWQVTRVVSPDELRKPDKSLREQIMKFVSPQGGEDALTHSSHSRLYITHEVHCVIRLHSVNIACVLRRPT